MPIILDNEFIFPFRTNLAGRFPTGMTLFEVDSTDTYLLVREGCMHCYSGVFDASGTIFTTLLSPTSDNYHDVDSGLITTKTQP